MENEYNIKQQNKLIEDKESKINQLDLELYNCNNIINENKTELYNY